MLKELIDQFYLDNFKEREQDHFYITDAGKCPRSIYFKFKGAPRREPEARVLRIFDHGDYTHMRLMAVLFGLGIVRAVELRIPPQSVISGRADAILDIDGIPYVLEIKSTSSIKFAQMRSPETDHLKQIQLYMHYFKIPQGILLYEDKNTQHLKDFIVRYDADFAQGILQGFEVLKEQIDKNIIPDIPPDIEAWRCQYCEYREECQRVQREKIL